MKTGADLEQARDAAAQHDAALRRLGDAAEDLEQRALAGTVAADDADDLAPLDLEAHILERPEFLDLVALNDLAPAQHVGGLARKILYAMRDDVAQTPCSYGDGARKYARRDSSSTDSRR